MTKDKAIQNYFETWAATQTGMSVYTATSVPDDAVFPWMTYTYIDGSFKDPQVAIDCRLWFHTDSEAVPNAAARSLRSYIEENDTIDCDEGWIWMLPGSPWSQSLKDDTNPDVKARYINITAEFMTV